MISLVTAAPPKPTAPDEAPTPSASERTLSLACAVTVSDPSVDEFATLLSISEFERIAESVIVTLVPLPSVLPLEV